MSWFKRVIPTLIKFERQHSGMTVFYQCPDCGFKQRSKAEKRIKCHRCGRSYKKSDAKKTRDKTDEIDEEVGTGFFRYTKSED